MIETNLIDLPHGITLSVRSAGAKGRPVLVFLHGFPEAAFVWDGLLAHFAAPENGGYRCVAPNLRGFERSSAPSDVAAYRPKHLVQDIAALIALECQGEHAGQAASAGPPQARPAPSGGSEPHAVGERGGQLACLVAHDWGGAVAWNLMASQPQLAKKLAIINSPHPGTFLRELQHSPAQQAASAYMNFLIRPDAAELLVADDFKRLWQFFNASGASTPPGTPGAPVGCGWLTEAVKDQYRAVWGCGLEGGLNFYRASPLRPPRPGPPHNDPAASGVVIPPGLLHISVPTMVLWGMADIALPPPLLVGLKNHVPQLQLHRIDGASHWIIHEQPALVTGYLQRFLSQ